METIKYGLSGAWFFVTLIAKILLTLTSPFWGGLIAYKLLAMVFSHPWTVEFPMGHSTFIFRNDDVATLISMFVGVLIFFGTHAIASRDRSSSVHTTPLRR